MKTLLPGSSLGSQDEYGAADGVRGTAFTDLLSLPDAQNRKRHIPPQSNSQSTASQIYSVVAFGSLLLAWSIEFLCSNRQNESHRLAVRRVSGRSLPGGRSSGQIGRFRHPQSNPGGFRRRPQPAVQVHRSAARLRGQVQGLGQVRGPLQQVPDGQGDAPEAPQTSKFRRFGRPRITQFAEPVGRIGRIGRIGSVRISGRFQPIQRTQLLRSDRRRITLRTHRVSQTGES